MSGDLILVGPTCTGKTSVAMLLAEELGAELVCADSVQWYSGLEIGSGVPTYFKTPHHFYGTHEVGNNPIEPKKYRRKSGKVRRRAHEVGRPIIFEGGNHYLASILRKTPPAAEQGPLRVICLKPKSGGIKRRIGIRLDEMIEQGLIEETQALVEANLHTTQVGRRSILHRELTGYILGEKSLDTAMDDARKIWYDCWTRQMEGSAKFSLPVIKYDGSPEATAEKILRVLGN